MSESKQTIKVKIINRIAEKEIESMLLTKKLSEDEQRVLYVDTFNYYKDLLKEI